MNLQPKSLPFIENDFDYSHNNLPPPFSLAKRNAAEKSRFVDGFEKNEGNDEIEDSNSPNDDVFFFIFQCSNKIQGKKKNG